MVKSIQVAKASELPEGTMRKVKANGRHILITRVGGRLYAVDNTCPHMGGDLSQGKLEGTIVTCPRHGSRFDLRDGLVKAWAPGVPGVIMAVTKLIKPPTSLTVYPIKSVGDNGDNIELELEG